MDADVLLVSSSSLVQAAAAYSLGVLVDVGMQSGIAVTTQLGRRFVPAHREFPSAEGPRVIQGAPAPPRCTCRAANQSSFLVEALCADELRRLGGHAFCAEARKIVARGAPSYAEPGRDIFCWPERDVHDGTWADEVAKRVEEVLALKSSLQRDGRWKSIWTTMVESGYFPRSAV